MVIIVQLGIKYWPMSGQGASIGESAPVFLKPLSRESLRRYTITAQKGGTELAK